MAMAAGIAAAVSCEETPEDFAPADLTVSVENITFDPEDSGANTFTVSSNAAWRVSCSSSALQTDKESGNPGTSRVTVTSAPEGESVITIYTILRGDGDRTERKTVNVSYHPDGSGDDPGTDPVPPDTEPEDIIYYEDFDGATSNDDYYIDQSDMYINKTGSGAGEVEYSGRSIQIRNNYPSRGYTGASGENALYFTSNGLEMKIAHIALPAGENSFRLTFGNSSNPDMPFNENEDIRLSIANQDNVEAGVRYSRNSTSSGWALCTSDFTISGTVPSHIDLIFGGDWQIRIDDVKLIPLDAQASQTISFENRQYPWPELPETLSPSSDYKYITHRANTVETRQEVRNYTACYDTRRHNPMWVASAHHACYLEGSGRTYPDPWRPDPEMTEEQQSIIYPYDYADWPWDANGNKPKDGSYYWSANYYTDEYFTKGHLLRSDDRRGRKSDLNIQTFYPTNISPEMYLHVWDEGNGETSTWTIVENLLSYDWTGSRDTVYVVTGCWYGDESHTAIDASDNGQGTDGKSKTCIVPEARYRVILKTKSGNTGKPVAECSASELTAIGFWYPQYFPGENSRRKPDRSEWIFSVSEIEDKIRNVFDFFPTVDEAVKETYDISLWEGLEEQF